MIDSIFSNFTYVYEVLFAVLFATNLLLRFRDTIKETMLETIENYKPDSIKKIEEIKEFLLLNKSDISIPKQLYLITEKYETRFKNFSVKAELDISNFLIDLHYYVSFLAIYFLSILISTSFISSSVQNAHSSFSIILLLTIIISIFLIFLIFLKCNRKVLLIFSFILLLIPLILTFLDTNEVFILIKSFSIEKAKLLSVISIYILILFFIIIVEKYLLFIRSERKKYIVESEDRIKIDILYNMVKNINNIDTIEQLVTQELANHIEEIK